MKSVSPIQILAPLLTSHVCVQASYLTSLHDSHLTHKVEMTTSGFNKVMHINDSVKLLGQNKMLVTTSLRKLKANVIFDITDKKLNVYKTQRTSKIKKIT